MRQYALCAFLIRIQTMQQSFHMLLFVLHQFDFLVIQPSHSMSLAAQVVHSKLCPDVRGKIH